MHSWRSFVPLEAMTKFPTLTTPSPCPLLSSPLLSSSPQPIFTPLLQLGSILDRLTYWKKFRNVLSLTEGLPKVSKNFLEACRYSCPPVFAVRSGVARKTPLRRRHSRLVHNKTRMKVKWTVRLKYKKIQ